MIRVAIVAAALALGAGCVTSHAVHLEPIHVEPIHVRMDVNVRMENVEATGDEGAESPVDGAVDESLGPPGSASDAETASPR